MMLVAAEAAAPAMAAAAVLALISVAMVEQLRRQCPGCLSAHPYQAVRKCLKRKGLWLRVNVLVRKGGGHQIFEISRLRRWQWRSRQASAQLLHLLCTNARNRMPRTVMTHRHAAHLPLFGARKLLSPLRIHAVPELMPLDALLTGVLE